MEAANTSETSVIFFHTTQRNNPEDSHLQAILLVMVEFSCRADSLAKLVVMADKYMRM
jgi:hypothetical protein